MSVQPVRLFGDPVLRTRAREVTDFDAELARLVADLHETMDDQGGAGIAAPQIGVGLRVFTWRVEDEVGHLINPSWEPVGELIQDGPEGCLSIPGLRFDCRRAQDVVARGFDVHGEPVTLPATGMLARAVQHEIDHLDGVLFVDRLDPEARKAALAAIRGSEWFGIEGPVVKLNPLGLHGASR